MNFLLMVLVALAVQQPSASIEGVVVKLGSGEPIPNADVRLGSQSNVPMAGRIPATKTDSSGRFFFDNVSPGTYRVFATTDGGFVPAEYGQRSPTGDGTGLAVAAGQKVTGI